jgi:hypothetical protein
VELRCQEDNPEEQRQDANAPRLRLHVLTKTELRREWLQRQAWHLERRFQGEFWICLYFWAR